MALKFNALSVCLQRHGVARRVHGRGHGTSSIDRAFSLGYQVDPAIKNALREMNLADVRPLQWSPSKMINVCVVNPNFYRSSGVSTAIRRIYETLPRNAVKQYFVECGYGSQQEDNAWIPRDAFSCFRLMALNPIILAVEARNFLRWVKQRDICVVHVHHRRLAIMLEVLRRFGRFQVIYTGNLTYPFQFAFWLLSPRVGTAVSRSVADNMKRTMRTRQIHLFSNGCDFPPDCPVLNLPAVRETAICVARLEKVKAHDRLLQAWALLRTRGHEYRLLLVGEGSLRDALERQAACLGIADLIEFRGYHDNVNAHIDEALFAVLPSAVEGQPIVILEAAARGRATLVTDVDGSRDCVPPDGTLPNRIAFGDVRGLADALQSWFARAPEVVEEGRRSYRFLRASSASNVVGSQYRALYENVAAS
jgi:glycosyltransferase involved in cell wall biosynthesis